MAIAARARRRQTRARTLSRGLQGSLAPSDRGRDRRVERPRTWDRSSALSIVASGALTSCLGGVLRRRSRSSRGAGGRVRIPERGVTGTTISVAVPTSAHERRVRPHRTVARTGGRGAPDEPSRRSSTNSNTLWLPRHVGRAIIAEQLRDANLQRRGGAGEHGCRSLARDPSAISGATGDARRQQPQTGEPHASARLSSQRRHEPRAAGRAWQDGSGDGRAYYGRLPCRQQAAFAASARTAGVDLRSRTVAGQLPRWRPRAAPQREECAALEARWSATATGRSGTTASQSSHARYRPEDAITRRSRRCGP